MSHATNVVFTVLICLLALSSQTIGGEKTPHLEIPRLKQSPTVDGQFGDDEWAKAGAMSALTSYRLNHNLAPDAQQATFFLGHNGTTLFLGMKAPLPSGLYPRSSVNWDDSQRVMGESHVEWQILKHAPKKAQKRGKGFYKLSINALGSILDEWLWGPLEGEKNNWDANARCQTTVSDGWWTLEMAVPASSFGVEQLSGQTWRMQLVRADGSNHCYSEWGPGSWLQWKRFPTVHFSESSVAAQLRNIQHADRGHPSCTFQLAGGEKPARATVSIEVNDPEKDKMLYQEQKQVDLQPETVQKVSCKADKKLSIPSEGVEIRCRVKTGDRLLLRRRIKIGGVKATERKKLLAAWRDNLSDEPPEPGKGLDLNPSTLLGRLAAIHKWARPIRRQIQRAFDRKDLKEAEEESRRLLREVPFMPDGHLALARIYLIRNKPQDALKQLENAAAKGGVNVENIRKDPLLHQLTRLNGFSEVVEIARNASPILPRRDAQPEKPQKGTVRVKNANVEVTDKGLFLARFAFPDSAPSKVTRWNQAAGKLLQKYNENDSAAGNWGDLYDNRDRDHSAIKPELFPQLTFIKYSESARTAGLDYSMPRKLFHDAVVIGNASLANTRGDSWSSLPRNAYRRPVSVMLLYLHYRRNHLYAYPEHRDYDADHQGDVFFANTPYVVISQGSSGSDKAFLQTFAATLAAFQPETKSALVEKGLIAPTLQMIMRRSLKGVNSVEQYLSGQAHRPVFPSSRLRPEKMVRKAQSIAPDALPPLVQLQVLKEETTGKEEKLFTTPAAVARVFRGPELTRTMRVSARNTVNPGDHDLKWKWVLLQGDPDRVDIQPVEEDGPVAEINVDWHPRYAIGAKGKMKSNRIDVGVFATNGKEWSAPSFLTWYCPNNEKRDYSDSGELISREKLPERYIDPSLIQKD